MLGKPRVFPLFFLLSLFCFGLLADAGSITSVVSCWLAGWVQDS